jgi:hypothetical protein
MSCVKCPPTRCREAASSADRIDPKEHPVSLLLLCLFAAAALAFAVILRVMDAHEERRRLERVAIAEGRLPQPAAAPRDVAVAEVDTPPREVAVGEADAPPLAHGIAPVT